MLHCVVPIILASQDRWEQPTLILMFQCDSSSNNNNSKSLQRRAEELHSQEKSLFPLVFLMLYNPLNSNRSRSSNQVQGTSFIVDSSTPPPHLEAQAAGVAQTQQPAQSPAPTLSVYLYQYLHLPDGKLTENNGNNKAEKNCSSFMSKYVIFFINQ